MRIDPTTRDVLLDGGERSARARSSSRPASTWRRLAIDGFDRLIGKGIYYGAARSEAGDTQGLDVHLIGAGNSAGQAALFFANHARTVTLVVRGDVAGEEHVALPDRADARQAQHRGPAAVGGAGGPRRRPSDGDRHRRPPSGEVRRHECGGLFVFIGADAETEWLPAEIARDARGYVLTGDDVVKAGRWSHSRDPYLLETSVPGIFACGDVR